MTEHVLLIVLSLALLCGGAEGLVRGSASLARRLGLSSLVVGLTVVAFGTSAPELVVSLRAAFGSSGDIAVANVVGSNCFNIGVILGLAALVRPLSIRFKLVQVDTPIMVGVSVLLFALASDHRIGRLEGAGLLLGIAAFTIATVWIARRSATRGVTAEFSEAAPAVLRSPALDAAFIIGGLGLLVVGANLLVHHAIAIARMLNVSEAVIGLTIVAAGTSMPELATSVIAAVRREPDIAVGNVVGSNIFNILGILGCSALARPLELPGISRLDFGAMVAFAGVLMPMLWTGRRLGRAEGAALLAGYAVYLWALWPN